MANGLALSVLDLVGMHPGEGAGPAIARLVDLAKHVEVAKSIQAAERVSAA